MAAGDREGALSGTTRALEASAAGPDRMRLLRLRAELRAAAGDDGGVVEDLLSAREAGAMDVLAELRDALLRQRKKLASKKDKEGVRQTTIRLIQVLLDGGAKDEAREAISAWLQHFPEDLEVLRLARRQDEDEGNDEGLFATLARLVRAEEGAPQAEAAEKLADIAHRLGRAEDAREPLEHVLLVQPEAAGVRGRLRVLYERAGAKPELAELSLIDADHAPNDSVRYARLREAGKLLLELDWAERAIDPLETAQKLRPDDPEAMLALVDGYTAGGRAQEAGEMVKKLLAREKRKKSPQVAALQLRMARVARGAGDKAGEVDWLRQAFETDKNNGDVAVALADLAEAQGDDDLALKALQTLTLMKGQTPIPLSVAFYRQARIAARRGERQRAVLWARRALVEDAEQADARKLLKDLGES
jgi:tetratricopeptide (TPR) repeat protein